MKLRNNEKLIAGLLVFVAATFWAASWYVEDRQADYRSALLLKLSDQETIMGSMAVLIDNDGADAVVSEIIKDCPLEERARFDTLLGSLSQLNRAELVEVDRLFEACASFYADRRQVLTARLGREIEARSEYLELYRQTGVVTPVMQDRQDKWQQLHSIEVGRTRLTTELVTIQGDIIDLLIAGQSVQSEDITAKVQAAQAAKDTIMVHDITVDALRNQLIDV